MMENQCIISPFFISEVHQCKQYVIGRKGSEIRGTGKRGNHSSALAEQVILIDECEEKENIAEETMMHDPIKAWCNPSQLH